MGYPKDRKGNTIYIIRYGFSASNGKHNIFVYTQPYKLGIYVYMYKDGKIYNQVSKDTQNRLHTLLDHVKNSLEELGYQVEDLPGSYKIKRTKEGFFLKPRHYVNPFNLKPNKK